MLGCDVYRTCPNFRMISDLLMRASGLLTECFRNWFGVDGSPTCRRKDLGLRGGEV